MHAYKFSTTIPEDHRLTLPDDIPIGPAEVTVLVEEQEEAGNAALLAFVEALSELPGRARTIEEIDQELARERDSWE